MSRKANRINGITLIELMIAMLISVIILGWLTNLYFIIQIHTQNQEALQTLQENADMTLRLLRRDIRMAGYIGCPYLTDKFPLYNTTSYPLSDNNRIAGIQAISDRITLRYREIMASHVVLPMQSDNVIYITLSPEFHAGDIAIISDCQSADIFQIKNIRKNNQAQMIETISPLHKKYNNSAEVGHLIENTYYINNTGRKSPDGNWINALYVNDIKQDKTELVEGIERLKIQYDVMQNGQIALLPANQVTAWDAILGVEIIVLVTSLNHVKEQKTWHSYIALKEK